MSFVLHKLVERRPLTWKQLREREEMERRIRKAVSESVRRAIGPATLKRVRAAFSGNTGQ